MWCDGFFSLEREEAKSRELAESGPEAQPSTLDANYADLDWVEKTLSTSNPTGKLKGLESLANVGIQWIHSGPFPTTDASPWSSPLDPFDTIREHNRPAAPYIRVYCQEMHYSFGWKMMTIFSNLFKSKVAKSKRVEK